MKLLKRTTASLLAAAMLFSCPIQAHAEWQEADGKTYYTDESGNKLTGWQEIDGNKY